MPTEDREDLLPDGAPSRVKPMTAAREKLYGDVLAGMDGSDDDAETPKPKKAASGGSDKEKGSSASRRSGGADADDPEVDDEDSDDDDLDDEGEDIDEDDEDEKRTVRVADPEGKKKAKKAAKPAEDDDGEEEDELTKPDEGEDVDLDDEDDEGVEEAPSAKKAKERAYAQITRRDRVSIERDRQRRQEHDRRIAEFDRERSAFVAEWQPKVQAYETLVKNASVNPIGAIEEFAEKIAKLRPEDFEPAARALFGKSPKAAEKPELRERALEAQRRAAERAELEAVKREQQKLRDELAERDARERNAAAATAYVESATKAIGKSTPLMRRMAKTAPNFTRREIHRWAMRMAEEAGQNAAPKPAEVVADFERYARRVVRAIGVDVKSLFFRKPAEGDQKSKTTAKPDKSKGKGTNGTTPPPKDRRALHEDVLQSLSKIGAKA